MGTRIYQMAPPVPERVATDGQVLLGPGEIRAGQNIWQAMGGMESGSVWGHGSYVAPDWTADWLHREAVFILNDWAREQGAASYDALPAEGQAGLRERLQRMMRANTYDPATRTLILEPVRARAFATNLAHYSDVFSNGREAYAIPAGTLSDPDKLRRMSGFFFWSSWAAATERPGDTITYTSNWPHEELIGNRPTGDDVVWTGVSIILLLAGIGGMAFWQATQKEEPLGEVPESDPLLGSRPTASQRATVKYFWTVSGLILFQIVLGVITAHYGVEGNGLYGIPLAEILPYTVTRTWHVQLGIF